MTASDPGRVTRTTTGVPGLSRTAFSAAVAVASSVALMPFTDTSRSFATRPAVAAGPAGCTSWIAMPPNPGVPTQK